MSGTTVDFSLHETFGCLTIGGLLAMGLWGAGSVQVYYYFDRYPADSLYLKIQVFIVWALETVHQSFVLGALYRYLVTHYADLAYLQTFESLLRDSVIITGIVTVIVQSIFVDRIYLLSKKNLALTGATAALALGQFVCTLVHYVKIHPAGTLEEFRSARTFLRVDLIVTTVADIAIAATLVYLYYATKTGFKKSDTLANKVLAFTVNTGSLTAACAVMCLILNLALPNTFVYALFYFVLVRLYMNSVVTSLNARSVKTGSSTDSSGAAGRNFRMTDMRDNRPEVSSYSIRPTGGPRVVTIKVDTETILDNDPNELSKGAGRADSDTDGDGDGTFSQSKGRAL